jgi:hypothetical protein
MFEFGSNKDKPHAWIAMKPRSEHDFDDARAAAAANRLFRFYPEVGFATGELHLCREVLGDFQAMLDQVTGIGMVVEDRRSSVTNRSPSVRARWALHGSFLDYPSIGAVGVPGDSIRVNS